MTAARAITRLTLRRFRSHETYDQAFDGRPVAISGPNGAGKTNILEAISTLAPGRGLRGATTDEMAMRPDAIGWAVAADVARGETMVHVAITATIGDGSRRAVRIDGEPGTQTALGGVARILWLTPAMDRLWIEGASERRRFLDRLTQALDPRHAERAARYEKALRERNRLLKDQVGAPSWYEALEARMAEAGAELAAARAETVTRLAAAQTDGAARFPRAEIALLDGDAGAPDGPPRDAAQLAAAWRDGRRRDLAAGRTLAGPHRADLAAVYASKGMEARHCSTGEQKALLLSLVLATVRVLSQDHDDPPLTLLDEVAAHLDPDRRRALFDELVELNAQAWLTAAERNIFDDLGDRAQHIELVA